MGSRKEDGTRGIRRRDLLKHAGVAGAVAALPVAGKASAAAKEREAVPAIAAAESDTLNAMLARLIPTDANGPGATEARVGRFIDRMLSGELRPLAPAYEAGLAAVDEYARATHGAPFARLAAAQQDSVLADLDAGRATGFEPDSRAFFGMVHNHALMGMFSDPVHGGNADFAGWDLIGYPGVKLVFTEPQQRVDVEVRKVHKSVADYDLFKPGAHHGH